MEQKEIRTVSKNQAQKYAEEIAEKHYSCKIISIDYVGGGSFGYVFKLKLPVQPYTIILKACRVDGMSKNEVNALKTLGSDTLIHIPEVYFTFDATDDIPIDFIGEEFIEGSDCFTDYSKLFKGKSKKQKFANEIANALGHWHNITNDKFGDINNPQYDNWLDFYKPFAQDILTTSVQLNKNGTIDNKTLQTMQRAWKHFDYIFSDPIEKASLIHGDLNVMNIMSDKNLNITAIIDPLECKWADKEFDLFQLRNLTGEQFKLYKTYKKRNTVSEKCDIKCAFYALYHEVYCGVSSGNFEKAILKIVVKRMNRELNKANLK